MDKHIVVHPYTGILPGNKTEWTTDLSNSLDESQKQYAEWKKPGSNVGTFYDAIV